MANTIEGIVTEIIGEDHWFDVVDPDRKWPSGALFSLDGLLEGLEGKRVRITIEMAE